ncbi:hypothetical protein, partial [Brasilonema octagenarum]|uniref:hypothetical protein n=1 Tax=Brasilonema octagenarum TaxID=417105 RepID=UPI001B7D1254
LTLPCRASLSLLRRGKDFSAAKSEGEVKSTWIKRIHLRLCSSERYIYREVQTLVSESQTLVAECLAYRLTFKTLATN